MREMEDISGFPFLQLFFSGMQFKQFPIQKGGLNVSKSYVSYIWYVPTYYFYLEVAEWKKWRLS